jgi:hypothetical protein
MKGKMRSKKHLLMFLIPVLFSCGDSWDSSLQILNRSKRTINYQTSDDSMIATFNHPDLYLQRCIPPDSIRRATIYYITWNLYIDSSYNRKLNIWFFDTDTIKKYMDMDYIMKKKLFIKKMEISKSELVKRKYIITFF